MASPGGVAVAPRLLPRRASGTLKGVAALILLPPSLGVAKAEARAEVIAAALTRELGTRFRAEVAATYADLEAGAREARAELVWAPAAVCARLTVARGVWLIVRDGRSSYRSALVARREDRLSLGKLAGKRAAWVDPLSAGGHLLAIALLRARGVDPEKTFASQAFVGSHRAALLAVLQRDADVAAVSAHGLDDASLEGDLRWYVGAAGDRLEAIALTERCPNDALLVTENASTALAVRFRASFVTSPGSGAAAVFTALEAEGLEATELSHYRLAFAGKRPTLGQPGM